jgi:TetR/AcrR family transcriptional regulator, transcriptional repressor of aconitase
MKKEAGSLDRDRRKQILDAAFQCFLQFGYAKTSMDDIARKANLSRPLIYLKFKSKQDLFWGLYVDFVQDALEQAELVLKTQLPLKEKLIQISEILTVNGWEKVVGHPMSAEFYALCQQQLPRESEAFERQRARVFQKIFNGDKEKAEIFILATDGFHTDLPSVKTLRRRIAILSDQFAGSET